MKKINKVTVQATIVTDAPAKTVKDQAQNALAGTFGGDKVKTVLPRAAKAAPAPKKAAPKAKAKAKAKPAKGKGKTAYKKAPKRKVAKAA